jgi:protein-tyrosine phosphatase
MNDNEENKTENEKKSEIKETVALYKDKLQNEKNNETSKIIKTFETSSQSENLSIYKNLPSFYDPEDMKYQNKYYFKTTNRCFLRSPSMNEIIPRLYLSDDIMARNRDVLIDKKITHILNVTLNIPNKYDSFIKYKKIAIYDYDGQEIAKYFPEAINFIDGALTENETNKVLVHCNAGVSRSASFVIAYLLEKRLFTSYDKAFKHVFSKRPIVSPNNGFQRQLIKFEKKKKREDAVCLIQ